MKLVDPGAGRRRRVAATFAAVVLGAVLVPVLAHPAQACSCVADVTDAEAYEGADTVFAGRVESVTEPSGLLSGVMSSGDPVVVTIAVDTVYKGAAYERTPVITARDAASCGIEFAEGVEYAVFASYGMDGPFQADDDELTASMCNGTRPMSERPLELVGQSGDGWWTEVSPMEGEPKSSDGFPLLGWLSYVAVAGLGLMPLALWLRFRAGNRSAG